MKLPQAIGAHIEIPTYDRDQRRKAELAGFVIERGTAQIYTMRRDFPDGVIADENDPRRSG